MIMILVAVVAALLHIYLPWWSAIIPAALLGGWMASRRVEALGNGGLGIGLLWLGYAGYIHWMNEGIMADRIAQMLGGSGGWMVLLATFAMGLLTGSLGAWAGYEWHELKDS
ncbi:MAG: hypothetical protein ACQETE_05135 [Bacteroidota bacterium]